MGRYWPIKTTAQRMKEFCAHRHLQNNPVPGLSRTVKMSSELELLDFASNNIENEILQDPDHSDVKVVIETGKFRIQMDWINSGKCSVYVPSQIVQWLDGCTFDCDIPWGGIPGIGKYFSISFEKGTVSKRKGLSVDLKSYFVFADEGKKILYIAGHESEDIESSDYLRCHRSVLSSVDYDSAIETFFDKSRVDPSFGHLALIDVIYKLSAYISAFPEVLKIGPPSKKEFTPSLEGSRRFTVTPPADKAIIGTHGSPCAHWRRGHFATLRDERYRRNADGTPRVIFRHAAIVAAKGQEIYHISDEDELEPKEMAL